jgi:acetyltransferase
MTEVSQTAEVIVRAARNAGKPVIPVFIGGQAVAPGIARTTSRGLPTFATPDRAIDSLDAVSGYAAYRRQAVRRRQRPGKPPRQVVTQLKQAAADGRTELGGLDAAAVVKPYGIDTPLTIRAADTDDAVAAAKKVGYPVALKIDSPDILHKTDVGGVQLDLANPEAVAKAFEEIMKSVKKRAKGAEIRGVTVSPMLPAEGIDLLIGAKRDPSFGPVLAVGQGGIFVEGIGDVAYGLAPLSPADAEELLMSTRIGTLLEGARGTLFDKKSAVKAVLAVSQLMLDNPQISELELNPYRAFPKGGWALDIRLLLS